MVARQKNKPGGLVYSTDKTHTCSGCLRPIANCVCKGKKGPDPAQSGDGIIRLHRETKGRKGAGVTLIKGLSLQDAELKSLAKRLKSACGVGGAIKQGIIELQGDQREKVKLLLELEGHRVKLAGG